MCHTYPDVKVFHCKQQYMDNTCIHIHTYMYTHTHTRMHACTHASTHVCMHARTHTSTHTFACTYTHRHMHVHMHIHRPLLHAVLIATHHSRFSLLDSCVVIVWSLSNSLSLALTRRYSFSMSLMVSTSIRRLADPVGRRERGREGGRGGEEVQKWGEIKMWKEREEWKGQEKSRS